MSESKITRFKTEEEREETNWKDSGSLNFMRKMMNGIMMWRECYGSFFILIFLLRKDLGDLAYPPVFPGLSRSHCSNNVSKAFSILLCSCYCIPVYPHRIPQETATNTPVSALGKPVRVFIPIPSFIPHSRQISPLPFCPAICLQFCRLRRVFPHIISLSMHKDEVGYCQKYSEWHGWV